MKVATWNYKPHCNSISSKYIKNESCESYFRNKEQRSMFSVVSRFNTQLCALAVLHARLERINYHEINFVQAWIQNGVVLKQFSWILIPQYPVGIYLLKVNNRNTRTRCEICSKLTKKTPERHHWRRSGVFTDNYEYISHLVLVFILITLNM